MKYVVDDIMNSSLESGFFVLIATKSIIIIAVLSDLCIRDNNTKLPRETNLKDREPLFGTNANLL